MSDVFSKTFEELSSLIRQREISPAELAELHLDRISQLDPVLKSFVQVLAPTAMEEARIAESEIANGCWRGPLHGIPVAVKDNIDVAGTITTNGMTLLPSSVSDEDAGVVSRLRASGAVIVGKLKLTEGAFSEHHPAIEPPRNPWGAELWPGASSSGAAVATAAGLCVGALGTDTGGSIRFPSDVNGLTSLKPTYGLVSRSGVRRHSPSMDHIGPFGRDVQTVAALTEAIAGPDERDPTAQPFRASTRSQQPGCATIRIGFDPAYCGDGISPEITAALMEALQVFEGHDFRIVEIGFPCPEAIIEDYPSYAGIEMAAAHRATYPAHKEEYGPALRGLIERGLAVSSIDFHEMIMRRAEYSGRVARVFDDVDVLLVPTAPFAAPTLNQMASLDADAGALSRLIRFTVPFNVTGLPALVLPCGRTSEGYPFTMQIVGDVFSEALLFHVGAVFQQATQWHKRRPPIYHGLGAATARRD